MRRIIYAGTSFYTGDTIAEALMDYARVLASKSRADAVFIPGRLPTGEVDKVEVLIGPASQLVSEPVEDLGPDLVDAGAVADLRDRTQRVERMSIRD
ncbi:hypothetical protein ACO2Q7_14650 [Rathayibacter sp. KR2-224]|uniref:hypothetical protein n=1 Tax=Rathayibacter sp. KR2-224 TaxID=3400913 RepID=UPI003C0DF7D1